MDGTRLGAILGIELKNSKDASRIYSHETADSELNLTDENLRPEA